jgi:orotate phosphoribosyltransferase
MEAYKETFIDVLFKCGAFRTGQFKLKSGRMSPYFVNTGVFNSGTLLQTLGEAYAASILDHLTETGFDAVFGPSYKGIPIALSTTIALNESHGVTKGWLFDRKERKTYGEFTSSQTDADAARSCLVGAAIKPGMRVVIVDDVFTTGDTKSDVVNLLRTAESEISIPGLFIAVDRMEKNDTGKSAIDAFVQKTAIPVYSIVNIYEIVQHLSQNGRINSETQKSIESYLQKYGSPRPS